MRDERRLSVFEKGVLRKIFGPKRDEVTGEWRKLHNKELRDLYSPNTIKGKVIPLQPRVAHRVGRGIALLFHDRGTRRW